MIAVETGLIRRDLKFKFPAKTSRGTYLERPSWYILYRLEPAGKIFVGEVSPLVDLSDDYLRHKDNFDEIIRSFKDRLVGEDLSEVAASCPYSSIRFALESILQAIRIDKGSIVPDLTKGIETNGLVWMGSHKEMLERLHCKLKDGYRCIKFKIGAIDFDSELQLIQLVRKEFGPDKIVIRLDANGAFKDYDEAMFRIEKLARYQIHSLEQPVKNGQPELMRNVIKESPIAIGLDEELIGIAPQERKQLISFLQPHYLVIKPTLHGGLSGAEDWARIILERGGNYWITSSLEGNIGLQSIALWCLENYPQKPLAYGLGTGDLFTNNFEPRHKISGGILKLLSTNQPPLDQLLCEGL